MLNPASPVPLYHQLAELLDKRIVAGTLRPGQQLPSEPELARTFHIGRPTVRQATEVLMRKGLVERRRGAGTFVRLAPARVDLFSLAGTLSSFQRGGLTLVSRLLGPAARTSVAPDPENPFAGREALSFSRVGSVDGKHVLVEHIFLEPEIFPNLQQQPELAIPGFSLSRLIEDRYHLTPTHAEQSFRVAQPPAFVRTALGLPVRAPVLLVKRTLFFPAAPKAVFCQLYCHTDTLVFSQTIGAEQSHG